MSDGMGRELAYLSSHATNRFFIPNWGNTFDYVVQVWEGGKWNTVAVKSDYVAAQSALNKYYSKGYRYTRIEQLF